MEDLSLHILDIAENSVRADAGKIEILITRDTVADMLRIEVIDDGKGMDPFTLSQVRNPFFSTRRKKTGLGIPLLAQAAEQTGGGLTIESAPGKGTRVAVTFGWSNLDRPPMGSMTDTVMTLIAANGDRDFVYEERNGDRSFRLDTREIKADLEGVPVNDPSVLTAIRDLLKHERVIR